MLTLEYAKNPIWDDETGNGIFVIAKFEEIGEELPFLATNYDTVPHGIDLFNRIIAGEFGEIAPYVPPPPLDPALNQPSTTGTQTI